MSQDQLGGLVHVSGDLIGRIEKAQRWPPSGFAERCDRALDTGGVLSRLLPLVAAKRAVGPEGDDGTDADIDVGLVFGAGAAGIMESPGTDRADRPESAEEQRHAEEAEVRRGAFLQLTGATIVGLVAPPLVCAWPDAKARAALDVDPLSIDQLRAQTEGLRWLDRREGSYRHLPAAARHARQIARLRRLLPADHFLRREVAGIAADACHLVAFQVFDQGYSHRALEWYRAAADLAAAAGQKDLYVFAMCGVAFMYTEQERPEPGLARSVLDQLADLELSPGAACYVETYRAYAHAAEGTLNPAQRALDRAERLAAKTGNDAPTSWLGVPDAAWVARQHAIILSRFGKPQALTILDDLDRNTPAVFRRYRITMTCDRALTHAHTGEADHAADLLVQALELNQRTRSREKHRRILAARSILARGMEGTAVRRLDRTLRELSPDGFFP